MCTSSALCVTLSSVSTVISFKLCAKTFVYTESDDVEGTFTHGGPHVQGDKPSVQVYLQ